MQCLTISQLFEQKAEKADEPGGDDGLLSEYVFKGVIRILNFFSFWLLTAMEDEDMHTEEEKMELEDSAVGHNINNSNIFSVYC